MNTPTASPRLIVELAPHSLQFVLVDAEGRVTAHRECAPDATAVAAALAEAKVGAAAGHALALLVPAAGLVLRANAAEAASVRAVKSLLARAEAAAHGLELPLEVVAFDSINGQRIDTVGTTPWVLAVASAAQVSEAKARLAAFGLGVNEVRLALPAGVGAVVTALEDMPESTRVLLWQIGETDAQLACISAGGCEAAGTHPVGFTQIYEAVQAGLGLKFRAAAMKLFFNPGYDFTDTAGPIAERIAALLRPAVAALGCPPTALQVAGLPAGQAWLAKAVASALDVELFAPKVAEFCAQCGLKGDAINPDLPGSGLGLLFQAAAGAKEAAWRSARLDANAPMPVKPAVPVAPKPSVAAPAPVKSLPVAAPAPAPVPVAAGPMAGTKPLAKPLPKPAPAPVVAAEAKAKPITPLSFIKPAEPAPARVPEAMKVQSPAAGTVPPAPVPAKKPVALWATVAAIIGLGGVALFFVMRGGGGGAEQTAAVPAPSADEVRLRELEQARMLAEELKNPRSFRNERYSFEVSDRGLLRKLVGAGNRTLIDEFGWVELQGTIKGTPTPFYAGTMADQEYVASVNKTVRDGRVVFEIKGVHPKFAMDTLITCLPEKLRIETVFKPLNMQDARGPLSGAYRVMMNRQSLSLGQRAAVEPGAISYATQSGKVTLAFNRDVWSQAGQAGEAGKQTFLVGSNLVFFNFAADAGAAGTKLTTELTLP